MSSGCLRSLVWQVAEKTVTPSCTYTRWRLDFLAVLSIIHLQIFARRAEMYDLQMLIDRVRQHGCRVTRQRAIILQTLCELDGHASAESIHDRVTLHRRDVDLSTVYRTLERLRELRIVSQTDLGRGCAEYEIVTDPPHHHLVCQGCGQVIDLDHAYLAAVADAIQSDFDFDPILDHFVVFGLCHECRGKAERGCHGVGIRTILHETG